MEDNTRVIGELIDLSQTPEQVLFLKELDAGLIINREKQRRKLEAELDATKSVYTNVIREIVSVVNRGY